MKIMQQELSPYQLFQLEKFGDILPAGTGFSTENELDQRFEKEKMILLIENERLDEKDYN